MGRQTHWSSSVRLMPRSRRREWPERARKWAAKELKLWRKQALDFLPPKSFYFLATALQVPVHTGRPNLRRGVGGALSLHKSDRRAWRSLAEPLQTRWSWHRPQDSHREMLRVQKL